MDVDQKEALEHRLISTQPIKQRVDIENDERSAFIELVKLIEADN